MNRVLHPAVHDGEGKQTSPVRRKAAGSPRPFVHACVQAARARARTHTHARTRVSPGELLITQPSPGEGSADWGEAEAMQSSSEPQSRASHVLGLCASQVSRPRACVQELGSHFRVSRCQQVSAGAITPHGPSGNTIGTMLTSQAWFTRIPNTYIPNVYTWSIAKVWVNSHWLSHLDQSRP